MLSWSLSIVMSGRLLYQSGTYLIQLESPEQVQADAGKYFGSAARSRVHHHHAFVSDMKGGKARQGSRSLA